MIPLGTLAGAGLLLSVVAAFAGYAHGVDTGSMREREAQQRAVDAANAGRDRLRSQIETAALRHLQADQQRTLTNREIVREISTIVERPVYRVQCVDADGVRLLDRAAAAANGEPAAAPAGPATAASDRRPQRNGDGRQTVPGQPH